jgi:hypothetical protein
VVTIVPLQCKMARTAVGWGYVSSQTKPANRPTRLHASNGGEELRSETVAAIQTALEKAGVEFIPENGGGAGVRLAKKKSKR